MKRICLAMTILMLLVCDCALAAKARSISTDADSAYHAQHLARHIGETACRAVGNYVKVRSKANGSQIVGHLEQADTFILRDVNDRWAQIEIINSADTSPDSWNGMTGWVNADYADCGCNDSAYYSNDRAPSSSAYPDDFPDGWSFSSGAGAWSTQLRINPDGSFYGYYHDADGYTLYESDFNGRFSDIRKTSETIYSMSVSQLKVNGVIGSQCQQGDFLHIVTEPNGIQLGDTFCVYMPGADRDSLSEEHLSWLHGIIDDPLSSYALCNMTYGVAFDPDSGFPESLKYGAFFADDSYRCTADNLRIRNSPNGPEILGHLEKKDQFIVNAIAGNWAHIFITHSSETSPDSHVGLSGWVSLDYLDRSPASQSDSFWKAAYRNHLSESGLLLNTEDTSVFWLAYVDNDDIPELIIDTQITAGGCHILTYHHGKVDSEIIGCNGYSWYIERENRLLNSAGQPA